MPFKREATQAAKETRQEENLIPYVRIVVKGGVAEIAKIRGTVQVDIIDLDHR